MTVPKNGKPRAPRRTNGQTPKPRLRVVKVLVQPMFVLDDGKSLREVTGGVSTVMAAEWQSWAKDIFSEQNLADLAAQVEGEETP